MTYEIERDKIFEQAKSIANDFVASFNFESSFEEIIYMFVKTPYNSIEFSFSNVNDQYSSICSVVVSNNYYSCCREEMSDDIGFYEKYNFGIKFTHNRYATEIDYSDFANRLNLFQKMNHLMMRLDSELTKEIIIRGDTHEERVNKLADDKARTYCKNIVKNNCKHLRIESSRVLPSCGDEYKFGDYTVHYNDKDYKVILSPASTLLIRTA